MVHQAAAPPYTGPTLGWLTLRLMERVRDIPTAIVLQFVFTFVVWIPAEQLGLSAVLTMVCYPIAMAPTAPGRVPAPTRISTHGRAFEAGFSALPAVLSGVQDIRAALGRAEHLHGQGRQVILFIDESPVSANRNKIILLPSLRAGSVTLIGATTENSSFTVVRALLACATR